MGISRVELSRLLLYNCTTEQKNAMFFTRTSNGQRKRNSMGLGQKITKLPEGITERIHFNDISSLSQQPYVAEINHKLTLQAIEGVMRFFFQNHRLLPNTLYQSFWSLKSLRNCLHFIKALKKKTFTQFSLTMLPFSDCQGKGKTKKRKIHFFLVHLTFKPLSSYKLK